MPASQPHKYKVTILEQHLDAYGHVNNVAYIALFEEARWDLITAAGCGLDEVKSSGIGPVVLEIQTKFRKELRLRQNIVIETTTESWQGKVGVIRQVMTDASGTIYCEARFTMGLFDLGARKLIRLNSKWANVLGCSPEDL